MSGGEAPRPATTAMPRPSTSAGRNGLRSAHVMCALLLILSIFFQKVAIPGTGGLLPMSFLGLVGLAGYGLVTGQLVASLGTLTLFVAFALLATLSAIASTAVGLSRFSLAFLLVVQFPLALRLASGAMDPDWPLDLFNRLMAVVAALGIAQFLAQFALGPTIPFALDLFMPPALALQGFNQVIPLEYGSPYLKSNGVFLAEPSFFSQFLAIGVVVELTRRCRRGRLTLYAAALVVSFSGTGLLMLAIFVPLMLLRRASLWGLVTCLSLAVAGVGAAALGLASPVERLDEFGQPGSSGYARFVSPLVYIHDRILPDTLALAIGRGPGTVWEAIDQMPYPAFDPTWAKLFYEYGSLGFVAYLLFFASALTHARAHALKGPLVVTYFFLGGYTQNPFMLSLLVALLVWAARPTGAAAPRLEAAARGGWRAMPRHEEQGG